MPKMRDVAIDLRRDLQSTEAAFLPALAAVGTFFARLPAYERESGISPVAAQPIYDTIAGACVALADARKAIVLGHGQFVEIGKANGVLHKMSGPTDCPPTDAPADVQSMPMASLTVGG